MSWDMGCCFGSLRADEKHCAETDGKVAKRRIDKFYFFHHHIQDDMAGHFINENGLQTELHLLSQQGAQFSDLQKIQQNVI
ncbi:hypothetical protein AV530_017002 [Patagioenas fasciata monilis]|uniref:Uncharacterized protein n=1 Tax=Patagioenas fasciata monilis TaxID=372326 RepID=A0A1V4J4C4_PATFA|nr:hypothetical protein AV530_017002 [Patagioenas fasciata monilis]